MEDALNGVPNDPEAERHGRALFAAQREHGGGNEDEGEVPQEVERHHGAGVGPVGLPLLQLIRRRLPHQQGRLAHRPATAPAQEPSRSPERRPPQRATVATAATAAAAAEERCRVPARNPSRGMGRTVGAGALVLPFLLL